VTGTTVCTPEEKRSALERALHSRTLSRSEQLRAFLRFVCEAEMEGRLADLSEYVIGVEVLGRREGYSPAEDSSVRTRAYELRQKLEKLYAVELLGEAVHIMIAKGSYAPHYVKASPDEPQAAPHRQPAPAPFANPPSGRRRVAAAVGLVVLGAFAGVAITLTAVRPGPKVAMDPILMEAWRPMTKPDANVLLCAATPLHLTVGPAGHQAYGTREYPAPAEAYPLFRQHRSLPPDMKLGLLFTDNVLGVGTMNAVVASVDTLRSFGAVYQILPERVATLSTLRNRNAILFGAPVDSEAIARTMQGTPLIVDYDASVREFVIVDRTTGKIIHPQKDLNGEFTEVYGLVTVLNTREGNRGRLGMIVFSGITSAGTHGAAEFFSSPRHLSSLRSIFARDGFNGFPAAYQVVVKCIFNNWLLVSYEYYTHKVIQKN